MSFYGQVVYEFTKLFNTFIFKNKGKLKEEFPKEDEIERSTEFKYSANERWDKLTFETGNKWIQMMPDNENQSIKFFHSKPSEEVLNSPSFSPQEEVKEEEINKLNPGHYFEIQEYGIDKAGHISTITPVYYQLPLQQININSDVDDIDGQIISSDTDTNQLHFLSDKNQNENGWIELTAEKSNGIDNDRLKFSHKIQNNLNTEVDIFGIQKLSNIPNNFTTLSAGDYISTNKFIYDKAGHLTVIEPINYQLPITDFETNLDELNSNMNTLFQNNANIAYEYADSNIQRLDERINELPTSGEFKSLENQVGDINSIYENIDSNTMVSTIGQVDGNQGYSKHIANMINDEADSVYSVSESLSAVAKQITALQSTTFNLQTLVQNLTKRIEELEKQ